MKTEARDYYRKHPVEAAQDLFGIYLSNHQVVGLMDLWLYPRPLLNWSRGMSKTFIVALYCLLRAYLHPKTKIGFISPSMRQAREVIEKIKEIESIGEEKGFGAVAKFIEHMSFGKDDSYIRFTNGSKVSCVPIGGASKGKSSRGYRFHIVFVDEYAFLDENVISTVAKPFLNVKAREPIKYGEHEQNQLIIASSSWFRENHFFLMKQKYEEMMAGGSDIHKISEFNVLDFDPSSDYDLDWGSIEESMETMPRMDFAMEYLNKFPSMKNPVIGQKTMSRMFNSLTTEKIACELAGDGKSDYIMAIDPAEVLGGDNFCILVMKLIRSNQNKVSFLVPVYCDAWNSGKSMGEAASDVINAFISFRPNRIMIDTKGGGAELIKNLNSGVDGIRLTDYREKDFGESLFPVIVPTVFGQETNTKMLSDMLKMIERGRVRFAKQMIVTEDDDLTKVYNQIKFLKTEIARIKPKVTSGGNMWIQTDSAKNKKKDRVVCFVMACSLAYRTWFEKVDDFKQEKKKRPKPVFGRIRTENYVPNVKFNGN